MNLPDWRTFEFEPGVLAEPVGEGNRLILWLKADRDSSFQYWERVGSVVRGEVAVDQGLCATAATSLRTRQRIRGGLGQLFERLRPSKTSREFQLPDGSSSEQCGERRTDLMLVWSPDQEGQIDELRIHSAWPQGKSCRRLGRNLFLVSGVEAQSARPAQQAAPEPAEPPANPREHAENLLAAARRAGDRPKEATALTDLGVILLGEGNAAGSIGSLESALAIARELGDAEKGRDIMGNLGLAKMAVGQAPLARELFEQGLIYARSKRDHLAEKTALERLGLAHWHLREFSRALSCFEEALALARLVGDKLQAGNLLWYQGIQHAELGQRDLAIARAEESIALFKSMGRPQAAWYGQHLQKYRMGLYEEQPAAPGAGVGLSPHSFLGGSIVASVMAGQSGQAQGASQANSGPGLLRMAMSATKAMATFIGSGMKATPPDIQQKRIQTCASCEHHTGMRCKICGCFTNVKSKMLHEDCPIGKWPA